MHFMLQGRRQLVFSTKAFGSNENLSESERRMAQWEPIYSDHLYLHSFFSTRVASSIQTLA